jgi:predicted RNA-binding Zn-ribbon protein involved in translation (DUF1610 family)
VADPTPSRTQRLFRRLLPGRAEDIERESRAWMLICTNCGFERSVWEMGGVRYKAKGSQRVRGKCPSCGESGWHRMERRAADVL